MSTANNFWLLFTYNVSICDVTNLESSRTFTKSVVIFVPNTAPFYKASGLVEDYKIF